MALKTVLETTEGLDEAVASLYRETEGMFVLDLNGVDDHPEVANLKSAYEAVKANLAAAKTDRDKYKAASEGVPDDFDPERWAKLKDGQADEAAKLALKSEYEAKITDLEAKLTATQESALRTAVERDLTQELTTAGVTKPAFVRAAQAMLADGVQIGSDGKAFVETDMGPLSLSDRVKRWVNGEGKDFVTAPKGGGSKSGSGNGSVTKEQFAVMGDVERTELLRSDPEKFKELTAP